MPSATPRSVKVDSARAKCARRASAEHELRGDDAVERLQAVLQCRTRAHAPLGAEFDLGLTCGVVIRETHRRRSAAMRGQCVLKTRDEIAMHAVESHAQH